MNDKDIMAGLLLDKDKAAIPEAIKIVTDTVSELSHLRKQNHELKSYICAILSVYAGNIIIDKSVLKGIGPNYGFAVEDMADKVKLYVY